MKVRLTPREMEIISLKSWGYTNKQIAGRYHLSIHTVRKHVDRISEKIKESTGNKSNYLKIGLFYLNNINLFEIDHG